MFKKRSVRSVRKIVQAWGNKVIGSLLRWLWFQVPLCSLHFSGLLLQESGVTGAASTSTGLHQLIRVLWGWEPCSDELIDSCVRLKLNVPYFVQVVSYLSKIVKRFLLCISSLELKGFSSKFFNVQLQLLSSGSIYYIRFIFYLLS